MDAYSAFPSITKVNKMSFNLTPLRAALFLLAMGVGVVLFMGAKRPPQRCTAIQVPTSTNLPTVVVGQRFESPTLSKAFTPILSTVELPSGFKAVGGGSGFVIACTD